MGKTSSSSSSTPLRFALLFEEEGRFVGDSERASFMRASSYASPKSAFK